MRPLLIGFASFAFVATLSSGFLYSPPDPFGGGTQAVRQGDLVETWRTVSGELVGDHAMLGACIDSNSVECEPSRALWQIIAEARNEHGLAVIGHINRSINLAITPNRSVTPSQWLTALDAIHADGDCKAYAIAKYFALHEVGITPGQIRLVIVHAPGHVEDHMVAAVLWDGRWLILDNATLVMLPDAATQYAPLYALDGFGVRQYRGAVPTS